jgi:acyl-CoA dehydrogenase
MLTQRQSNTSATDFDALLARIQEIGNGVIAPNAADVDQKARFPAESFAALRELKLLSAYVPVSHGGMGLSLVQMARICEVLGHYCGSTAMIFAMHQIMVACVVRHAQDSKYFNDYLRELAQKQLLIASATTEIGVGGDLRSSICAVEVAGERFTLTKKAPVISYGEAADDIMVTCRRAADAPASDQVQVLVRKSSGVCKLEPLSGWDTLGFRGTCSSGYTLSGGGSAAQIQPVPFSDILTQTMHPHAHILWSSLWLGIASSAVNQARAFVRQEARKNPNAPLTSSLRLAEVDAILQTMRSNIHLAAADYQELMAAANPEAFSAFGFTIRINNLKLTSSTMIIDVVGRAMIIVGISSYRNDSKFSLCRHLRDAYGAALMVNNDRIMNHNSNMLLVHRQEI